MSSKFKTAAQIQELKKTEVRKQTEQSDVANFSHAHFLDDLGLWSLLEVCPRLYCVSLHPVLFPFFINWKLRAYTLIDGLNILGRLGHNIASDSPRF